MKHFFLTTSSLDLITETFSWAKEMPRNVLPCWTEME